MAAYIHIIYYARVARSEQHIEVIGAASDDCALLEVLQDERCESLQLIAMVAAEVNVVIDNGASLCGPLQHLHNQGPHASAGCKVGPVEHNVAAFHSRQCPGGCYVRRLFVEEVAGILVLTQESQTDGTLLALPLCADAIGTKEVHRLLSDNVCSCIADECTRHSGPPHTDDAVETAATCYCCHRLPVLKDDIQDGFAYSYDFSAINHFLLFSEYKSTKKR